MPVTKTARRALVSSKRKAQNNKKMVSRLEVAIRLAKKSKAKKDITSAISLLDRAAKRKVVHKNKASRLKSVLSKVGKK